MQAEAVSVSLFLVSVKSKSFNRPSFAVRPGLEARVAYLVRDSRVESEDPVAMEQRELRMPDVGEMGVTAEPAGEAEVEVAVTVMPSGVTE